MRVKVKMGGKKDGTITALFMEVCANTGPFGNHCLTVPMNSCSKTLPLFAVDNMAYDLKVFLHQHAARRRVSGLRYAEGHLRHHDGDGGAGGQAGRGLPHDGGKEPRQRGLYA